MFTSKNNKQRNEFIIKPVRVINFTNEIYILVLLFTYPVRVTKMWVPFFVYSYIYILTFSFKKINFKKTIKFYLK